MIDLDYIYTSELPNRNANSVHVTHFSEALSTEFNFRLFAYIKNNKSSVYKHYAIRKNFNIEELHLNKYLNIIFLLVTKKLKKNIYVRDFFCALILALFGKNVIWEAHIYSDKLIYKIAYKFASIFNFFFKIVVITEALKEKHLSNFKYECLEVLPDGCRTQIDIKNHSKKSKLNIGYVGSFHKGKGVETIIKIAEKVPEHNFIIVGGTNKKIFNLKKTATSNIKFKGYLNQSHLPMIYKDLDIALLPNMPSVRIFDSGQEIGGVTSPLKLFEYFSYGIPIIASDLDVLKEVLNSNNSILVQFDDIKMWCEAIKKLENIELREKLSNNGLEELKLKYSWSVRAVKVKKFFL